MLRHITEIVENVTFIILEICMLVIIIIQTRLIFDKQFRSGWFMISKISISELILSVSKSESESAD